MLCRISTRFWADNRLRNQRPKDYLDAYYHAVVLPTKRQLDIEYMAQATFLSDLRLLVNSVLHRWDDPPWKALSLRRQLNVKTE